LQRLVSSFAFMLSASIVLLAIVVGCGPGGVEAESSSDPPEIAQSRDEIIGAVAHRASDLLSKYIRIDTVNPPGNEIDGARFLAELLQAEGIATRLFESEPGRGMVFAKLAGTGARRPLILLSHIDVVPAIAEEWNHPPFDGVVVDGAVHGCGALDSKGVGITHALAMIALKRLGAKLDRDIILLATGDEGFAHRRRRAKEIEQQPGMTPEVPDEREICAILVCPH